MRSLIYALIGTSFTLAVAWALGAILLRKLSPSLQRLEQRLLAITTGSALLSAIVFALCAAGIARKGFYLSAGLLAGIFFFRFRAHRVSGDKRFEPIPRAWQVLFVVVFGVLTVLHLFNATTPEIYPGDVTQHLSQVDRAHGFHRATLSEGSQLLLLPAFCFGRHAAAELVSLGVLASLSLLILCYGRRIGHPIAGGAAALLTYAGPAFAQHYSMANIDVITAAALFTLFYLLQLWDEQNTVSLLISIGILAGYSCVANHAAMMAYPYAIGFVAWKLWRLREPVLRPLLTISMLALAFIIPWMVLEQTPPNSYALFAQQHHWELLVLLLLCAAPALLALQLPAGRQLLIAASVLALPSFATASTQVLAFVTPFAVLALCLGLSNLAITGTGIRGVAHFAGRAVPSYAIPTRYIRLAGAALILAYFAFFGWDGLHARFGVDDPANLFWYWSRGTWPLIRAQFEFFSTYYRPMGGLFYLPIYDFAGFNPLPYRVVALLIVLLGLALFCRVAKLISGFERVAWVATILVCYHPRLADIIYTNGVIYDVLCFLFYFAALAWYLGIRTRGRFCTWRHTAIFVVLYICALNSKEMAVTLPLTLGLY